MKIKIAIIFMLSLSALYSQEQTSKNDPFSHDTAPLEEAIESPKNIHVYYELIEISSIQYAKLMTNPLTESNHTKLRNKLFEQVKKGEAKLISNQSILCKSGKLAYSSSHKEFIFAAEYVLPSLQKTSHRLHHSKKTNQEYQQSKTKHLPTLPTAFESRNLGTTLELEPILDKSQKTIELTFRPETVKHVDDKTHTTWNTSSGKITDKLPVIYTLSTNTTSTLKTNQFRLISTHSPELNGKPDETRKWLYFVKASILKVAK